MSTRVDLNDLSCILYLLLGARLHVAGYLWRGGPPDAFDLLPQGLDTGCWQAVDTCWHESNRILHIFTLFHTFSRFFTLLTLFQKEKNQEIYTFHINIRADFHKLSVLKKNTLIYEIMWNSAKTSNELKVCFLTLFLKKCENMWNSIRLVWNRVNSRVNLCQQPVASSKSHLEGHRPPLCRLVTTYPATVMSRAPNSDRIQHETAPNKKPSMVVLLGAFSWCILHSSFYSRWSFFALFFILTFSHFALSFDIFDRLAHFFTRFRQHTFLSRTFRPRTLKSGRCLFATAYVLTRLTVSYIFREDSRSRSMSKTWKREIMWTNVKNVK